HHIRRDPFMMSPLNLVARDAQGAQRRRSRRALDHRLKKELAPTPTVVFTTLSAECRQRVRASDRCDPDALPRLQVVLQAVGDRSKLALRNRLEHVRLRHVSTDERS